MEVPDKWKDKFDEKGIPIPDDPNTMLPALTNREKYFKRQTKWKDQPQWWKYSMPKNSFQSAEVWYLYDVSKRLGSGNYANLGTFRGASALALASGLRDGEHTGTVYAVDTYDPMCPRPDLEKRIEKWGLGDYIEVIERFTFDWADELLQMEDPPRFNFVFIDANHRYMSAKTDFDMYEKLLVPGGEIAFHDCDCSHVNRLICEIIEDWDMIAHYGKTKAFRRKRCSG